MVFLSLILIYSNLAFGKHCSDIWGDDQVYNELFSSTSTILKSNQQNTLCQNIEKVKNLTDLNGVIDDELELQEQKKKTQRADGLTNVFNNCEPSQSSTTLILSFTGTGSFEPQSYDLMASFLKCSNTHHLAVHLRKYIYYQIQMRLEKSTKRKTKWSGIEAGPLSSLLEDKDLAERARQFDYASFPSEESALISSPQDISLKDLRNLPREIRNSQSGRPRGVTDALSCTRHYFKKSRELGIKPKLVILSHSSGGRSTVKFLEALKQLSPELNADLVFSIDPVKEAQHAIQEVLSQVAGNAGKKILSSTNPFGEPKPLKPVNVWTRSQPDSLYKTSNAKKWINVYQNKDSHGLDMAIKFGIHGSPIKGADENVFIKEDLTTKAHGDIVKHEKVLELFKKYLKSI